MGSQVIRSQERGLRRNAAERYARLGSGILPHYGYRRWGRQAAGWQAGETDRGKTRVAGYGNKKNHFKKVNERWQRKKYRDTSQE